MNLHTHRPITCVLPLTTQPSHLAANWALKDNGLFVCVCVCVCVCVLFLKMAPLFLNVNVKRTRWIYGRCENSLRLVSLDPPPVSLLSCAPIRPGTIRPPHAPHTHMHTHTRMVSVCGCLNWLWSENLRPTPTRSLAARTFPGLGFGPSCDAEIHISSDFPCLLSL